MTRSEVVMLIERVRTRAREEYERGVRGMEVSVEERGIKIKQIEIEVAQREREMRMQQREKEKR